MLLYGIDVILGLRTILTIINLGILTLLTYMFVKRYLRIRSNFTLGFSLFGMALFFRTFLSAPFVKILVFNVPTSSVIDPYRLIADVFEFLALLIFLYISTR